MAPRRFNVLLVNPPIADFAAHDMWAAPVGLMRIAAALGESGIDYTVADFLGTGFVDGILADGRRRYKKHQYRRPDVLEALKIPRQYSIYGASPAEMDDALASIGTIPGLVVVSTMMTYWYPGVVEAVGAVNRRFPDVPVAAGGVYTSLSVSHARSVLPGVRVFTNCDMHGFDSLVAGLSGRDFKCFSKAFDRWPAPATEGFPGRESIPVSLVRGCPFACEYCADPILVPRMEFADAIGLAEWVRRESDANGVCRLAIFDDAFLADGGRYAKPFMKALAESGGKFEVHAPNGLHPKWVDRETAVLMAAAAFRTIRLSLETTDPGLASASSGKVETGDLGRALDNLVAAGYKPRDIGVYLLAGLPRQTPADVMRSIRHVESLGAAAYLPEYSPIPGTPLFDEALSIAAADIREPLLQNNSLLSCWHPGFPWAVIQELKDAARGTRAKAA